MSDFDPFEDLKPALDAYNVHVAEMDEIAKKEIENKNSAVKKIMDDLGLKPIVPVYNGGYCRFNMVLFKVVIVDHAKDIYRVGTCKACQQEVLTNTGMAITLENIGELIKHPVYQSCICNSARGVL